MATFVFTQPWGKFKGGSEHDLDKTSLRLSMKRMGLRLEDFGHWKDDGEPRPAPVLTPPTDPGPAPQVDTEAVAKARAEVEAAQAEVHRLQRNREESDAARAELEAAVPVFDGECGLRDMVDPRDRLARKPDKRALQNPGDLLQAERRMANAQRVLDDADTVVHRWKLRTLGESIRHRLQQLAQEPELVDALSVDHRRRGRVGAVFGPDALRYVQDTVAAVEEWTKLAGHGELRCEQAVKQVKVLCVLLASAGAAGGAAVESAAADSSDDKRCLAQRRLPAR